MITSRLRTLLSPEARAQLLTDHVFSSVAADQGLTRKFDESTQTPRKVLTSKRRADLPRPRPLVRRKSGEKREKSIEDWRHRKKSVQKEGEKEKIKQALMKKEPGKRREGQLLPVKSRSAASSPVSEAVFRQKPEGPISERKRKNERRKTEMEKSTERKEEKRGQQSEVTIKRVGTGSMIRTKKMKLPGLVRSPGNDSSPQITPPWPTLKPHPPASSPGDLTLHAQYQLLMAKTEHYLSRRVHFDLQSKSSLRTLSTPRQLGLSPLTARAK